MSHRPPGALDVSGFRPLASWQATTQVLQPMQRVVSYRSPKASAGAVGRTRASTVRDVAAATPAAAKVLKRSRRSSDMSGFLSGIFPLLGGFLSEFPGGHESRSDQRASHQAREAGGQRAD